MHCNRELLVICAVHVSQKCLHHSVDFQTVIRIGPSSTRITCVWRRTYVENLHNAYARQARDWFRMPAYMYCGVYSTRVREAGGCTSCCHVICQPGQQTDQVFPCSSCRSPKSLTVMPHMPMTLDMTRKLTTMFPFSHSSSTFTLLLIFLLLANICSLTLS